MTVRQIDPSLPIGYLAHQTTQKKLKKETTLTGIAGQHQDNISLSMPMFDIPSQLKSYFKSVFF